MVKKKLLFVCFAARDRSRVAVEIFQDSLEYEAKYAGISPIYAEVAVSAEAIDWADVIFAMEESQKEFMIKNFPNAKGKEIFVLDIPGSFTRDDPRLRKLLIERLKSYV